MRGDDGTPADAQHHLEREAEPDAEPTAGVSSEMVAPCTAPPEQGGYVVIVAQLVDNANPAQPHPYQPQRPPAQVPRRFGVGVLLLFLTAFSLLFCGLKWLQAPPWLVLRFCLLFVLVALAQMFSRGRPRQVSMVAGGIYGLLLTLLLLVDALSAMRPLQGAIVLAISSMFIFVPLGVFLGYLAGTLLAGMFLALGWRSTDNPQRGPQRASS